VSHRPERSPEELVADRSRIRAVTQARITLRVAGIFVELVAQQHAHGGPDGSSRKQPDGCAYDFPGKFHTLPIFMRCYSTKPRESLETRSS
jgi:hypothetical protein